ncbi:hypothetical protein Q8G15_25930, partial [Klebsiella pneumoniae]|uniref:hypothetical protein n=1 Tax=Klebsiella pneumoniae TaxID=573 RepID=UPI0027304193
GGTCRLCTGSTGGYPYTELFSFASFPVTHSGPENPRDDGDFYFPANLLINRSTFISVGIYSGAYHHTGARIYSLPKKFAPLIMQVQTKSSLFVNHGNFSWPPPVMSVLSPVINVAGNVPFQKGERERHADV